METQNPNHEPMESAVTSAFVRVQNVADEQIRCVESYTRQSPFAALAIAAATGYVLRNLPVRALAGLFLRLCLVLVRPLIFVVGAVKIYELTRNELPRRHDSGE